MSLVFLSHNWVKARNIGLLAKNYLPRFVNTSSSFPESYIQNVNRQSGFSFSTISMEKISILLWFFSIISFSPPFFWTTKALIFFIIKFQDLYVLFFHLYVIIPTSFNAFNVVKAYISRMNCLRQKGLVNFVKFCIIHHFCPLRIYIRFIVVSANTVELAIQCAVCSIFFNVPNSYFHIVSLKSKSMIRDKTSELGFL